MAGNMSIKAKDLTVFIDIVRSKPVLYDICHPNYKDSATIKLNNWQDVIDEWFEVSNELLDQKSVKDRWTNLRDTYVSNKRKYDLACASGAPATEIPKWKWWPYMVWYQDFQKKKSTRVESASYTNIDQSTSSIVVTPLPSKSTPTPSTSSKTTISPIPSTSATQQAVLTSAAPLKSKTSKKRKSDEVDKLDQQIEQLIGDNEDEAFFLSMAWAARFRKLSPYQQAIVRSGVDKVFFKAEFETSSQPPPNTTYTEML